MFKRSTWSGLALSAAVTAAIIMSGAPARAETAPAGNDKLQALADDFLHYSLINNDKLAAEIGDSILKSSASSEDILKAFEAASRGNDYREIIVKDQRREALKDKAAEILKKIDEGAHTVARDPMRIRADVERLSGGPRAYQNAKDHLAAAGEYAVPIMLEYLQNSAKQDLHAFIIRAMGEVGRPFLNPLVEALRVSDPSLRVELIQVLGQIGYPQALPTLRAMQTDEKSSPEVRRAVENAITRIDASGNVMKYSASDLFLAGARNYYGKKVSYQPLSADEPTSPVWYFDGVNNVKAVKVPTVIWNDVMAQRMAEATLRTDSSNAGAISLWQAANIRRELELPADVKDPTRAEGAQNAAFYAYAAGAQYMNPVLTMALDDKDNALALRAVDALEKTGGISGLVSSADSPLLRALSHPDRAVRFHAAFALARANPATAFPSYFRVVPLLADAVNSNSSPSAMLVVADDDLRNALTDALRKSDQHFAVYAGKSTSSAVEKARTAPAIDVIIAPYSEKDRVAALSRNDYRLMGVPVLFTSKKEDLSRNQIMLQSEKGHTAIDEQATPETINTALNEARTEIGATPLKPETATDFSTTALDLLAKLAADHKSIYNVSEATPVLITALGDKRPEVVTGAAKVLGLLNSADAQKALAAAALIESADAGQRVIFFDQLAESAKHTGNALDSSAVDGVIKAVDSGTDSNIRMAAARALGALNVASNQASKLILNQAK